MNQLMSHPGVPLSHHLKEVAQGCRHLLAARRLDLGLPAQLVLDLGYLMGAVHDLGKGTDFFQHYLLSIDHEITGPKHHALLSAVVAKHLADRLVQAYPLSETDQAILPYLVFIAVKRHHGNLGNVEDELGELGPTFDDLPKQFAHMDSVQVQLLLDEVLEPVITGFDWDDFLKGLDLEQLREAYGLFSLEFFELGPFEGLAPEARSRLYYLFQLLYSSLLLADKRDVVLSQRPVLRGLPADALASYRQARGFDQAKTVLNRLQNEAYFGAMAHLDTVFSPRQHLYSITLPTGMGKTLTSLGLGLALRQRLGFEDGRFIVAIPFTSIIDQNFEVYREVLGSDDARMLLKHHHLSEPTYKMGEDESDSLTTSQSQFLIETWDTQMVVTTFVQLLEVLVTHDKGKLLKLPQLANSVVILDEVQSIPYAYWPLIREGLSQVAKLYNTYFILMSATQPLIFEPEKEIIELIPDYRRYFQQGIFNRTKLVNRIDTEVSLADFVGEITSYADIHPERDVLVVLNTRSVAHDCFGQLREALGDENDCLFLSTLITPHERKRIIRHIGDTQKAVTARKRMIIVSTQLIEAGVDISVGAVFRALAPLDSIIQAAGRANRYGAQPEPAEVFLYEISELKAVSCRVYGAELLRKTRNVLKGKAVVEEKDYIDLIEAYYREVRRQADVVICDTLVHLQHLKFADAGKFQFIKEQKVEPVFIQLDEAARQVWLQYAAIAGNKDLGFRERKELFQQIKGQFYEYVINVPPPFGQDTITFDREKAFGFYVSPLENPSEFYAYDPGDWSVNTGYQPKKFLTF